MIDWGAYKDCTLPYLIGNVMATPIKIREMGNQLSILFDDGTQTLCYPSSGGLWFCGGQGNGPGPGTGDIAWPFNKNVITSGYGPRSGGVGTFHEGVDFSGGKAVLGADCLCAADGTVKIVSNNSGFGNYVGVFHKKIDTFDFWTVYGHLRDMSTLTIGASILKGDRVGYLGQTGTVTGPCLHWETHECAIGGSPVWNTVDNGNPRTAVDPVAFMTQYGSTDVLNA